MIKNELTDRWADELDSGKYLQGTNRLCSKNFYCCLGVLCELAVAEGIVSKFNIGDMVSAQTYSYGTDHLNKSMIQLPHPVSEWLGVESPDPAVMVDGELRSLIYLNDNGYSFKQIAGYIREGVYENEAGYSE